jgi:hypothetical protein
MKIMIVFESMFGNTESVARAIADGLHSTNEVEVIGVADAPSEIGPDVGLLVLGGPTHAFGMSRPGTRDDARRQGDLRSDAQKLGIREWLERVRFASPQTAVAVFDTRLRTAFAGSAARAARRRLQRLGRLTIVPPMGFIVAGVPGPLVDGEVDRARTWGAQLGTRLPIRT